MSLYLNVSGRGRLPSQETVDEENQKQYSDLMAELMDPEVSVKEGEKILLEARSCLKRYPDVLKQFDSIFMQEDLTSMVEQLRSVSQMKDKTEKMVAEKSEGSRR